MDIFIDALKTLQIFQYASYATVCLVTYEFLIKLDDEVRHLWGRRISFGGTLMALCRYFPFINIFQIIIDAETMDMGFKRCLVGSQINSSFIYLEFFLSILVLFTRTYAVWGGARLILFLLAFVLAGSVAGSSYAIFLFDANSEAPPLHLPASCLFAAGSNNVWISLTLLIICESLSLGLLLVKSLQHARDIKGLVAVSGRDRKRSILTVMAQDGIGYFACTLAITIANFIVLRRAAPGRRDFLLITQGALQNILCSRLLFHVRSVNEFREGFLLEHSTA